MKLKSFLLILLVAACATLTLGQDQEQQQNTPPQRGQRQGRGAGQQGNRIGGTITAIGSNSITIKSRDDQTYTVKVTPDTRFRKNRAEAKLSDFNVGDQVFVGGEKSGDNTITARVVGSFTPPSPEEMVKMGLGTKFVIGEVKSIDGTKITVVRPDKVEQTISVDENTSFSDRSGESVTLADIKPGDRIRAQGAMKGDTFVAAKLRTGIQGFGMGMGGGDRGNPPDEKPNQDQPKDEPKK